MKKMKTVIILSLVLFVVLGCGQPATEESVINTEKPEEDKQNSSEVSQESSEDEHMSEYREIQSDVDNGRQTWRLDPLAVAKETVRGDSYSVVSNDGVSEAVINVIKGNITIRVKLFRPVKQDATGIWVVKG
ncbi:MAG: hypothetical protein KAS39_00215, partial [Actinomycetia bacterium]|nr:hypothetical protein [Actinomycetes bacterium]